MGYSRLFRSRYYAALWAAGICWSAYWFASPGDQPVNNQAVQIDATGAAYSDSDVAALEANLNTLEQQ